MFTFSIDDLKLNPPKGHGRCILQFSTDVLKEDADTILQSLKKSHPKPRYSVEMTESNAQRPSNGW